MGRVDEAIVKLETLIADVPTDTEAVAYLGRIYKEMWQESWKWVQEKGLRLQTAFDSYHWLLKSFDTYMKGYRLDLDQFYPGVNALTLAIILIHLADKFDDASEPDPEIEWVRKLVPDLRGSLIFALETEAQDEMADYWALISLAELRVLTADVKQQVTRAYRKALTASRRNQFFLTSSLAQLEILRSLDLRTEFVQAGINVINEELRRIRKEKVVEPKDEKKSRSESVVAIKPKKRDGMVFLFTGYMVSNPRKKENQFPPEKERDIKSAITAILDKYEAGSADLAVTTGMDAGGEIIFVECCAERGIPVQAYFPVPEAPYVRDFVSPGGEQWVDRFYKMRNHPLVDEFYQPDSIGLPKAGNNVHERNNRWALYSALARGIDNVRLIAVWDGKGDLSRDLDVRLVKHMVELMRDTGGIVELINPGKLTSQIPAPMALDADSIPPVPAKIVLPSNGNGHSAKRTSRKKKTK